MKWVMTALMFATLSACGSIPEIGGGTGYEACDTIFSPAERLECRDRLKDQEFRERVWQDNTARRNAERALEEEQAEDDPTKE